MQKVFEYWQTNENKFKYLQHKCLILEGSAREEFQQG